MFETHSFYCTQCGNRGIPLVRKQEHLRETFHKKKLYCIYCKKEVNHIECRNQEEEKEFLNNFKQKISR